MPMPWKRTTSHVRLLQRAISHPDAADISGLIEALDATAQSRLWVERRTRAYWLGAARRKRKVVAMEEQLNRSFTPKR